MGDTVERPVNEENRVLTAVVDAQQVTDANVQAAVVALGAKIFSETVWTDNTAAYFVRKNSSGVITWFDMDGTAVSAPGTGAKPA